MNAAQRTARCGTTGQQALVLVVERDPRLTQVLEEVCGYLRIGVEWMSPGADLPEALQRLRPIAVVSDLRQGGGDQVLAAVAGFDPDLPVLLVSERDPATLRSLQRIAAAHEFRNLLHSARLPDFAEIMEFLFLAGRTSGMLAMMPS